MCLFLLCDFLEHGIENVVARRPVADEGESLEIRVDSILQGKIHENPAGKGAGHLPFGHRGEIPGVLVE